MSIPKDIKISKEHLWFKMEGNLAYFGISHYLQKFLGTITYLEIPNVGKQVNAGEEIGMIDALKTVYDIVVPFNGTLRKVNETIIDDPTLINSFPFDNWIFALELGTNEPDVSAFLPLTEYETYAKETFLSTPGRKISC